MKDDMDMLREVGNIAAAHGSIALSEILKKKVQLSVPRTDIISSTTVAARLSLGKVCIAVFSKIVTGLKGQVIFLLDERNAFRLNDISYKVSPEERRSGVMTEIGMSLIKEIGSMVTSAYVTALGMMFKRVILLAPPTLISGTIEEILNITVFSSRESKDQEVILIEAAFNEPDEHLQGSFYMVLSRDAAVDIKAACEEILRELGA